MDSSKISIGLKDVNPKSKKAVKKQMNKATVGGRKAVSLKRKRSGELTPVEQEKREKARQYRETAKARAAEKIIIGLDFGTTYLGVAYGTTMMALKDVEVLSSWTGGANDTEEKAPSRIAYASENPKFTNDIWGYAVKGGMILSQWTKLLLDASTDKTKLDDPLLDRATGSGLMRLPPGKDAKTVVTDLLRLVHAHVMTHLEKEIGKAAVEQTAFCVQATVPATWSLAAREATKQAVLNAGFASGKRDEVILVEEPEAASLWAIKSADKSLLSKIFRKDTTMTTLDMGGGTLDAVSHQIVELDPLQLEEACIGQGAKMGGTAMDRAFHALMEKRYGDAFTCLPAEKTSAGSNLMKAFEEIKRDFKGKEKSPDVEWVHLKMKTLSDEDEVAQEFYDFTEDSVKITSDDLTEVFEPVLQSSFALIQKQVERIRESASPAMRTLVLVGGLSRNVYVFDRIKNFVEEVFGKDTIQVVNPRRPWSAVCRGAVINSFEKSAVMVRRSRDWIGTAVDKKFDAKKHREEDRYSCTELGSRARNQMKWVVKRNEELKANEKRRIDCWAVVHNTKKEIKSAIAPQVLYRCPTKVAPGRLDESAVTKIGTVVIDITEISRAERAARKERDGKYPENLTIHIIIEIVVSSMKGVLEVSAKVDHKKVGSHRIEYFSDPAWRAGLVHGHGQGKQDDEGEGLFVPENTNEAEDGDDEEESDVEDEQREMED